MSMCDDPPVCLPGCYCGYWDNNCAGRHYTRFRDLFGWISRRMYEVYEGTPPSRWQRFWRRFGFSCGVPRMRALR